VQKGEPEMFRVGTAHIDSALELELTDRPIAWLGATSALIEANRWWMAPYFLEDGDSWSLNFRSWILRVDDKVVVIDPCNGNDRPNAVEAFDMLEIPFLERFEATGVRVEEVDLVFCTHLHHDHCGWNTMLRDGRWVPTFPNARYVFAKREYERWHPDSAGNFEHQAYNDGVYERSIAPIIEAGLADLVLDSQLLTPSLRIEAGPGHTYGHSMLRLTSDGEEAIFSGDAFHHPLQLIDHNIRFGDHDDWNAVLKTRERLVHDSLERNMLLIPAHLPFPHAGRMRVDRDRGLFFDALEHPHL
jgi:glyoxylase-like metal-dependent hydrolase (beta-lactamase superfamily II)